MNYDFILGPLSPQELDRVATFLKKESINFEISKDEGAEKEALRSSPLNDIEILYRNKTFTGQVFFITIHKTDFQKIRKQLLEMDISLDNFDDQSIETDHEFGKPRMKRGKWMAWMYLAATLMGLAIAAYSTWFKS